ncbi:MAG: bifunctional phosphoribosylaminoimidazolecarboxamide formyltransferase/IMP cyclohydrolase [Rhodospirillales bacterium]|nr:bifunctional phosphoribosylaminoimidazolecarboxamide formyltransferase/IMP cyclohydrolase [Rhodospirillales bacterium]MCB9973694.1 bifunctional phosphoribosylaminoimidazolecarboxamide formyltransferase/IMP cyclohydrolase [Rhodospirillales bacterium]
MTSQKIADPRAIKIKRALLSVSKKDGVVEFAEALLRHNVEILSTGGTAKLLKEHNIPVKDVAEETGFPEIMDGRVKTLHPKIHGGLLAVRSNDDHMAAMKQNGINEIDMLVVNLYPFVETVEKGADFAGCIENIDIGGPAMIRAAAKNHDFVTIVTDPQDYARILEDLENHDGAITYDLRKRLAATAFALTATYDSNIASWFSSQTDRDAYPRRISFSGNLQQELRYGENPHQSAALYLDTSKRPGVATASQIQGKELSYNNLNDTDAAYELVAEFEEPAVAIIKHANPCGVSVGKDTLEAYRNALACDPVSAFGGIIALNRTLDAATAKEIIQVFSEVIIAPSVSAEAIDILKTKKNLRVLTTGSLPKPDLPRRIVKSIAGGLLVQEADNGLISQNDLKIVTDREPTEEELSDMLFAFKVCKHVKSNAIVYAKKKATVGIGAGQMSRVDSARIAVQKSLDAARALGFVDPLTRGSVAASDAFFPFADGLITIAEAGATAIIQPGGSIRDEEVIEAANARGIAMAFTGMRHFRH